MNIGIIIFSKSGNTESVAKKVEENISTSDHNVQVEMISVKGEVKPEIKDYDFENNPDVVPYDFLIFASAVQAFSLNPAMKCYLNQIESLKDKKVFCFVTKALPFNWTGGNRALNQMKKICEAKGAEICGNGIVKWREKNRSADIDELIKKVRRAI